MPATQPQTRAIASLHTQAAQRMLPSGLPLSRKLLNREDALTPKPQSRQKHQPVQNRVRVLLVHIPKLSIRGQARLAAEVGVSRSTISRLVSGRINPSYRLARGVTDALERMLGKPLDMREVFSTDGTYLTPSGCSLCRCNGCLPEAAWDEDGHLKPQWKDARPGEWSFTPSRGEETSEEHDDLEPDETERHPEPDEEWKEVR